MDDRDKNDLPGCSVTVSGIPPTVSRDKLMIHFQRELNGGGEVKSLIFPVSQNGQDTAVIEFDDARVAQSVLSKKHYITRKNIPVDVAEFKDEVFGKVEVTVNRALFNEIDDTSGIDNILENSGVEKLEMKGDIKLIGKLYQLLCVERMLKQLSSVQQGKRPDATTEARSSPTEFDFEFQNPCRITLDKDIYDYMELNMKEEMDNIRNLFGVRTAVVEDAVCADFSSSRAEEGISRIQKMYQDTMDNIAQDLCRLRPEQDHSSVDRAMQKVRNLHPKILVSRSNLREVIFIGDSESACRKAKLDFERHLTPQGIATWSAAKSSNFSPFEELLSHSFSDTGLVVKIIKGDIADQETDSIVNAANSRLQDGAGVTGAIYKAGGDEFRRRSRDFMNQRGKELVVGEVVHTEACGTLRCKHVLHVTGPLWSKLEESDRRKKCQEIMNDLCWSLVKYSNHEVQSSSIAIPAIGTGIYGVPCSIFCEAMLEIIHSFQRVLLDGKYRTTLREIRLVNYTDGEARQMASFFRKNLRANKDSAV